MSKLHYYIEGTIKLEDGSTSEFSLSSEYGYQQWAAPTARLGLSVDIVSAMQDGLRDADLTTEDEDYDEGWGEYSYGEHEVNLHDHQG